MAEYVGSKGAYKTVDGLPKLGGGNGDVYFADGPDGRVAIKLLRSKRPDAQPRFLDEIRTLRTLAGVPGVLPLLDVGIDFAECNRLWFAMPVAITMRERLEDASLQQICLATSQIAGALHRVHARGVKHRDIKPDNLFWYDEAWCLGDFGLADRDDRDALTQSGGKLGPALYIAPEMVNNAKHADGASADVYSLGKTVWVLATGQTFPIPGVHDPTHPAMMVRTYRDDPRSKLLDELLYRMSQLDPQRRPPAQAVADELSVLSKEPSVSEPPSSDAALARLRAAVVPHHRREEEESRRRVLASEILGEVLQPVCFRVTDRISKQSQLGYRGCELPRHWQHLTRLGGAELVSEFNWANCFEAGGPVHGWRLTVAACCHLLSDDSVSIRAGYELCRMLAGKPSQGFTDPSGWDEGVAGPNGVPSTFEKAQALAARFEAQLPSMIDLFARLVEEDSGRS